MVIVDLQDLEQRARLALETIGGVVLEAEALLLIVSELRRMKALLGEQHSNLSGMRNELLQLRTELVGSLERDHAGQNSVKPERKAKLKIKVVAKDAEEQDGTAG
ncbi:MAG: hypothetical protein LBI88_00840 [Deltaproteobacteria bacterium]|jgi:hypothetical protein|nr:hypothetical protein [Deltaproteobacteria bacterium]